MDCNQKMMFKSVQGFEENKIYQWWIIMHM